MPEKQVVVYCISCIKSMHIGGKSPRYLVDLLFGEHTTIGEFEPDIWHAKLEAYAGRFGIARKWSSYGKTGLYGEFGQLKIKDVDIDPMYYGLGFSQEVTGAAATFYMNWRRYDLDISGVDDVNAFSGGVLIRF